MSAMRAANVPRRASADSTDSSSPVVWRKLHCAGHGREVRAFPLAPVRPELPPALPDELLDFYAFIFCQGGFRQLGMTFEQFLLVVATVLPGRLRPTYEYAGDRLP
jgi:hypothetical protein